MLTSVPVSPQTMPQYYRAILQASVIERLTKLQSQTKDESRKNVLQQAIERAREGKSS